MTNIDENETPSPPPISTRQLDSQVKPKSHLSVSPLKQTFLLLFSVLTSHESELGLTEETHT